MSKIHNIITSIFHMAYNAEGYEFYSERRRESGKAVLEQLLKQS